MGKSEKLELLVTVVGRGKSQNYLNFYEKHNVACQLVTLGMGTANSEILSFLGLSEIHKDILLSVIKESEIKRVFTMLEKDLNIVGKGIAFTIPLTSLVGVSVYNFLLGGKKRD